VSSSNKALIAELIAFGRELEAQGAAQAGSSFTPVRQADELIENSPNAFLLGLLFTQGIPAERAWAGPYLLAERLGSLDLHLLADSPERVRGAVQASPMLHRFKETLPTWISSAARKLLSEYDGEAANIWPPGTHVLDVTERLRDFDGVGRKKAVMAVEILRRHFGVDLAGQESGQVAYDVQVRRVFPRCGLVDSDTPEAIEAAAALACPESPGTLDLPTWLIGRETCRPRAPRCDECRLSRVCPRLTARDAKGVGVRQEPRT
jgi:endonuclease-3